MRKDNFTLFRNKRGFGLRIESVDGDIWEYPYISYTREPVEALVKQMADAELDPVHYNDVVRDYITMLFWEQLAFNRLA